MSARLLECTIRFGLTRCLKCLCTINCSASVALVVSRVTIGLRVMIALTGVVCGSKPSAVT